MKILIKDGFNNLVWQEVIYKNGMFRSVDDKLRYNNYQIYSVKDDDRNKMVICSGCGKEVRNTPAAIKAHREMINKPNKCFECNCLRPINTTVMSQKYVLNDNGTYTESTKRNVQLVCNNGYNYYDINSESAKQVCRYAKCENAVFRNIADFWTKYPNAFDEFITIDRIIEAGYKEIYKSSEGVDIEFKGRANLTAHINNQGLCCEFGLRYRGCYYTLRYSKKYDKVWVANNDFRELSYVGISDFTTDAVMKKIRSLYE